MAEIVKDERFRLAERYVEETAVSVFLTGKAGTGKTTFLRHIAEHTAKRFVVLAPTGVAAINACGSTIHSFFSLPLCPYLPDVPELRTEYAMPDSYRHLRKEKIRIIRTLDLLIIDEVSMVRADLLDAVDMTLRRYRRSEAPFGGVQLLLIGDAGQLSPVVTEAERPFLAKVYPSPYFFHSQALQRLPYVTIELETIYRQSDRDFIDILNGIRDNRITESQLRLLNTRVMPVPGEAGDWIRLTTHNRQADDVNATRMAALPSETWTFNARIEGDYPESLYPADPFLTLKEGAQVMFIRNDPDGAFYNGKIGWVRDIDEDQILITDTEGTEVTTGRMTWENLQYGLDDTSGEISQTVMGSFSQFPLRPAWAITIHKSQGLTFDHVIIDAARSFAFGQVYVALSRCRSLEGIILTSPIDRDQLFNDTTVAAYHASFPSEQSVRTALPACRQQYLLQQMQACFNFETLRRLLFTLRKRWREQLEDLYPTQLGSLDTMAHQVLGMEEVATKFRTQLARIHGDETKVTQRLRQAAGYFKPQMEGLALRPLLSVEIDNKAIRKQVDNVAQELIPQWDMHCQTLTEIDENGFSADRCHQIRVETLLGEQRRKRTSKAKATKPETPKVETRDIYSDNRHPELVEALSAWRRERARAEQVPAYYILHQRVLLTIADMAPASEKELLSVPGFGPGLFARYGEDLLKLIAAKTDATP